MYAIRSYYAGVDPVSRGGMTARRRAIEVERGIVADAGIIERVIVIEAGVLRVDHARRHAATRQRIVQDIAQRLVRITSYNVCYTKLLRASSQRRNRR